MSSSNQAGGVNGSQSPTAQGLSTQAVRAQIRERANQPPTHARLQDRILAIRNADEASLIQSVQRGFGSGEPSVLNVMQNAILAQRDTFTRARTAIVNAITQIGLPPDGQQTPAQRLAFYQSALTSAELQCDLALSFLQRYDNDIMQLEERGELDNLDRETSDLINRRRRSLARELETARNAVEEAVGWLNVAEEEAGAFFATAVLIQPSPPPLPTVPAIQTGTGEGAAARVAPSDSGHSAGVSDPVRITPRPRSPVDDGAGASPPAPLSLLRTRYQAFSAASGRRESVADARRRLDIVQSRASAAARQCPISPISGPVRATLSRLDAQLNTQSVLPGSSASRRNLMLHLHSVMNRQLLTALPTDEAQLRSFCLEPNADSGLSSLSVVQMLAATLRASQHQVIRDQIDEILNSHAAGR
ncbi:MAG: hypothetical protein ACRC9R_05135, partial [Enterovibrio sp.]